MTARLKRIPDRLAALRRQGYDPVKQPGFVAGWVKTKSNPWMGGLVSVDGILGTEIVQAGLRVGAVRTLSDNWPSTMLSSWTHLAFTCDGRQICAYRNGLPISSAPLPAGAKFGWGKRFSFGGKGPYGDAKVAVQSVYFHNAAFPAEAVADLYLWGKFPTP